MESHNSYTMSGARGGSDTRQALITELCVEIMDQRPLGVDSQEVRNQAAAGRCSETAPAGGGVMKRSHLGVALLLYRRALTFKCLFKEERLLEDHGTLLVVPLLRNLSEELLDFMDSC
ncbi:unnamed protein product [Pleuronectes platessa]|uniref:Uncharacterized protein n=1 Tax=Pleuronectes platessa TaxID=8262 RepID=A0A9N7YQ99_PLEPL|nr:unnamed protein product [Pleuronectes platessa]